MDDETINAFLAVTNAFFAEAQVCTRCQLDALALAAAIIAASPEDKEFFVENFDALCDEIDNDAQVLEMVPLQ